MFKVVAAFIIVVGIWVSVELIAEGPRRAFDGALAGFLSDETNDADSRSTVQRASDSYRQSHESAEARRKKMLRE